MSLNIKWQRLVSDGETCERCEATGKEVEKAVEKLEKSLNLLGVDVILEKKALSEDEFRESPKKSNLVFVDGEPLENWIGADVGQSKCNNICGDEKCRTIVVDEEEFEVVPSDLIMQAGMKAASQNSIQNSYRPESSDSKSCCS